MRAINIEWDTDGQDPEELGLPSEMQIPQNISKNDVADWLSDQTGWLVDQCRIAVDGHIKRRPVDVGILPEDVTWEVYYLSAPADLADVCFVLYGEASMIRIQNMRGAQYPCWALFSHDEDAWGRCEGPVPETIAAIGAALNRAMKEGGS